MCQSIHWSCQRFIYLRRHGMENPWTIHCGYTRRLNVARLVMATHHKFRVDRDEEY